MQHKKQISDQASGCAQRELDKERKYQKKSVAADWFVNFKEFMQSNSQERSNRGSCSTEKSFFLPSLILFYFTVFVDRLADNGGKQDEERCGRFWELPGQGE